MNEETIKQSRYKKQNEIMFRFAVHKAIVARANVIRLRSHPFNIYFNDGISHLGQRDTLNELAPSAHCFIKSFGCEQETLCIEHASVDSYHFDVFIRLKSEPFSYANICNGQ